MANLAGRSLSRGAQHHIINTHVHTHAAVVVSEECGNGAGRLHSCRACTHLKCQKHLFTAARILNSRLVDDVAKHHWNYSQTPLRVSISAVRTLRFRLWARGARPAICAKQHVVTSCKQIHCFRTKFQYYGENAPAYHLQHETA